METGKGRLHQLEIRVIENGLVGEDDADGCRHIDNGPDQKPPSQPRAGGQWHDRLCFHIVVNLGMVVIRAMDWHQRNIALLVVLRHLDGIMDGRKEGGRKGL